MQSGKARKSVPILTHIFETRIDTAPRREILSVSFLYSPILHKFPCGNIVWLLLYPKADFWLLEILCVCGNGHLSPCPGVTYSSCYESTEICTSSIAGPFHSGPWWELSLECTIVNPKTDLPSSLYPSLLHFAHLSPFHPGSIQPRPHLPPTGLPALIGCHGSSDALETSFISPHG